MISVACATLGERALIAAGGTEFGNVPEHDHVKIVDVMDYATALPNCRAFVHHGGLGTTNSGLRAGFPMVILWTLPDQAAWSSRIKNMKVGTVQRFSTTTRESLIADLRTFLVPR